MAEALLLSDKLNESIDHLNMNTRIESESDILFFENTIGMSELNSSEGSTVNKIKSKPIKISTIKNLISFKYYYFLNLI